MPNSMMIFSDRIVPINRPSSIIDSATTSTQEIYCHDSPSSTTVKSSRSIPISDRLTKTASEIQLCRDQQTAERLDYEFYSRVVSGISQSQCTSKSWQCRQENQMCLLNIMQTRTNETPKKVEEEVEDEWAIGHSLEETPCDENLILNIASEATNLSMPDDDDEIFEMEL
ncbi:unnamed protein product [Cylindrotheca closterium]|uniref:Uncharacterized protein n=1 Tax=Cylindrotheca closterium TaxID=2856 RepID=A0AAD2FXF5_9STRA|nr:unnamed protein product [Cylindrotheca closterium]